MQVRDLIEQLQQFDPRSSVKFDFHYENAEGATLNRTASECEVKRGPDTARILIEGV